MASPQQAVLDFLSQSFQAAVEEARAVLDGLNALGDLMQSADFNAALTKLCQEGKNVAYRKAVVTVCLKRAAVSNNGLMSIARESLVDNFLLLLVDSAEKENEKQVVEKLRSSITNDVAVEDVSHYADDFEEESPKEKTKMGLSRGLTSQLSISNLLEDEEEPESPRQKRGLSRKVSISEEEDEQNLADFESKMNAARKSIATIDASILTKLSMMAPVHDVAHTAIREDDESDDSVEQQEPVAASAEHKQEPAAASAEHKQQEPVAASAEHKQQEPAAASAEQPVLGAAPGRAPGHAMMQREGSGLSRPKNNDESPNPKVAKEEDGGSDGEQQELSKAAAPKEEPPRLLTRLSQLRKMADLEAGEAISAQEEELMRRPFARPRPESAPSARAGFQPAKPFGHQPRMRPPQPEQKPKLPVMSTVKRPQPSGQASRDQGTAAASTRDKEVRFKHPAGQEGLVSDDLYELLNKVRAKFTESEEMIRQADEFWRRRLQDELQVEVEEVGRKHKAELKELKLFSVMNIYHTKGRAEEDDELQAIRYKGFRTRALNRHKEEMLRLKDKLQEPFSRLDCVRDTKLQNLNAAAVRADHAMEHCIRSVEAVFGSKRDLFKLRAKTASEHALVTIRNSYRTIKAEVADLEEDYKAALRRDGFIAKSAPMMGSLRQSLKDYERKARLVEEKKREAMHARPTSAPFAPQSPGRPARPQSAIGRPKSATTALHARRERNRSEEGDTGGEEYDEYENEHYENDGDLDIANDDEYDGGFDEFDVEPANNETKKVKVRKVRRRKRRRGAKKKAYRDAGDDYKRGFSPNPNPNANPSANPMDGDNIEVGGSRRASSITASEFDKDNYPFFTYPCPHCKQFFRGQGFVMPTHLSLEPPVAASLRESQKALASTHTGNPVRLTFRQKLSLRYQDYFKKRYSIKPREIDTFCSWECLKSNAKQMVPVKFQYEMFQLIDLAAGHLVS